MTPDQLSKMKDDRIIKAALSLHEPSKPVSDEEVRAEWMKLFSKIPIAPLMKQALEIEEYRDHTTRNPEA